MPLYSHRIILRTNDGHRREALVVTLENDLSTSGVYAFEDPEDGFSDVGDLLVVGPVSFDDGVPALGGTVVTDSYASDAVAFEGNAVSGVIPPVTLARMLAFWRTSPWLPGPYRFADGDLLHCPKTGEPVADA